MSDEHEEEDIPYEDCIDGFSIRKRELTEEEATRDITLDRFEAYHMEVGEDFTDQHENIVDGKVLGGWMLAKNPELKNSILRIINNDPGCQEFMYLYEEKYARNGEEREEGWKEFYKDFAEFLNLTDAAKKRVNQILIQIAEYYG